MSTTSAHHYADSGFAGSMPNLATYPPQQYQGFPPPPGASYGPVSSVRYADDNPYGAINQPPQAGYYPGPLPPGPQIGVSRAETH